MCAAVQSEEEMHSMEGSGSSRSFATRRANYFASQGAQAQPMSDGAGVSANDPKATSGKEETVASSEEQSAKQ